ncbi:transposase [uncultured Gammaproteobacteria bacterium]
MSMETAMSLSPRCIETLLDLAENKLCCLDVTDREDARERVVLGRCIQELRAETSGNMVAMADYTGLRRRGRRPRSLELAAA